MFNPHPPLTGFPIALMSTIALCEVLGLVTKNKRWSEISRMLVAVACIVSVVTYFSGYWGVQSASLGQFKVPEEEITSHMVSAKLFLLSLVPCAIFSVLAEIATTKKALWKSIYYISILVALTLVTITSFKGGSLVFDYGASVNLLSGKN
jgi:uncharacterized membrane protein